MAKEKYISLKEAAGMSGYSADYVGQLIRSGKLPGKQVFSHVAWMTTEEALQEYLSQQKKGPVGGSTLAKDRWAAHLMVAYRAVLWGTLVLVALFTLLLIYVFSVSIDHQIDRVYREKIERP